MAGDDLSLIRETCGTLLGEQDPPAASVINRQGRSPFLLIGDHAGNRVPALLGTLGLPLAERERHIGWDIGIGALGEALAARIDAVFVRQTYSRLVIDCNRDPASAEAVPETSDGTAIPGNSGLNAADRAARVADIHAPYQAAITAEIARRSETILIALHSFTPVMGGIARPWDIGVLHDGANDGYARGLLARLSARGDLVVGDNEPYRMDATDHTVPRHAFAAGLPYAELEIRQDRLGTAADVAWWAELLASTL
jgi:predicted N-formylglutamate amidohydrolase